MAEDQEVATSEIPAESGEISTNDVVSQDTSSEPSVEQTEESVPEQGQTQSEYLSKLAAKNKWSSEEAAEQAAKMAINLESKLGNYKEVERKAQAYEQLQPILSNPNFQQILNPQETPKEPDMSGWTPEQIVDYRAELKAKALVDAAKKEMESKFMPFVEDYNQSRVQKEIEQMRQKYPDFDEYAPKIGEVIKSIPLPPGEVWDKDKLEFYYKAFSYDKAMQRGEASAYEKLRTKQQLSRTAKPSNAPTVSKNNMSFEEAWESAKSVK